MLHTLEYRAKRISNGKERREPHLRIFQDYIIKLEKKVGELEEKVASLEKEKEADQEPDVPEFGTIE